MAQLPTRQMAIITAFRQWIYQLRGRELPDGISLEEFAHLLIITHLAKKFEQSNSPEVRSFFRIEGELENVPDDELNPIPVDDVTAALVSLTDAMGRASNQPVTPGPIAADRLRHRREEAKRRIESKSSYSPPSFR